MKSLKKIHYLFTISLYLVMSHPVMARDLESIATNLTSKTNKLASLLVPIGFAISGMFMLFGNPRGTQMMSMTLMAGVVILGGSSAFSWLKNIVG